MLRSCLHPLSSDGDLDLDEHDLLDLDEHDEGPDDEWDLRSKIGVISIICNVK